MSRARARVAVVLAVASVVAVIFLVACIGDPPIPPLTPGDAGGDVILVDVAPDVPRVDASTDGPVDAPLDADAGVLDGSNPLLGFPSHTFSSYYLPNAASLPQGVEVIDTTNLTLQIDGGTGVPSGVSFALDSKQNAVLSIGSWTMDSDVTVTGTARLIIVAAGSVTLNAVLHGEAVGPDGGPGALAAGAPGAGANGFDTGSTQSGGGGGGFGTTGGSGGGSQPVALGGQPFGATVLDFSGGAPGGTGNLVQTGPPKGYGGGGGGAIQISSAVSIDVTSSGAINVCGGGGLGGIANEPGAAGGSGGMIFLEAPSVTVGGLLAANGGGGGTGDDDGQGDSYPGSDGQLGTTPALGGHSISPLENPGGNGAAGAIGADGGPAVTPAGNGTNVNSSNALPSGGGGGVGRIWFRSRGAPGPIDATKVSPPAAVDTSL